MTRTPLSTETCSCCAITSEQYEAMLSAQHGACAICERPETGRRLAVDHDKKCCPGKYSCGRCVRALLCRACNVRLFRLESGGWHDKAAEYVRHHDARQAQEAVAQT